MSLGPALHNILLRRVDHDKAFPAIDKKTSPELLPDELADYYLAEFKKNRDSLLVEKLELKPTELSGHQAFRLVMQTVTGTGLKVNTVTYGFSRDNGFYELSYTAPELHYFERDLPVFESLVESFKPL